MSRAGRIAAFPPAIIPACLLALAFCWQAAPAGDASLAVRISRVGPYGGEVRSILISRKNPSSIWLGTADGQMFVSRDSGSSWVPVLPGTGRRQLVIDTLLENPADADHLYAGGWDLRSKGGALYESRDAGETWTEMRLPEASPAIRDLAICRSHPASMIAGTLAGAYTSDDAGATWRRITWSGTGFENVESVAIDPVDPRFLYIGTWRLGYRSGDFGNTWSQMERGMILDSDVFSLSVDSSNPEVVYASACTGVYRSDNRAQSWTRLKVLPDRFVIRTHVVYVDPTNSHRIFAGTTEGLYASNNDGQTWTRLTDANVTVNAVQVDPANGSRILVATGEQGILRSDDAGRTWKESNTGFSSRAVADILPDPDNAGRMYVMLSPDEPRGGVHSYERAGDRWTAVTGDMAARTRVVSFLPIPGRRGRLAATPEGIYFQRGTSAEWTRVSLPAPSRVIRGFALDPANRWIYAWSRNGIYRSSVEKIDFRRIAAQGASPEIYSLFVSPGDPPVLFAASNLGIIRSLDQGRNWEAISKGLPSRAMPECMAGSPAEAGFLLAGTSAGLFESRDGGLSWSRATDPRMGIDVPSVIFLDSGGRRILAADGTYGGVFLSTDGGGLWMKLESKEFGSPVRRLSRDPGRGSVVYLGTRSEGVYEMTLPDSSDAASFK